MPILAIGHARALATLFRSKSLSIWCAPASSETENPSSYLTLAQRGSPTRHTIQHDVGFGKRCMDERPVNRLIHVSRSSQSTSKSCTTATQCRRSSAPIQTLWRSEKTLRALQPPGQCCRTTGALVPRRGDLMDRLPVVHRQLISLSVDPAQKRLSGYATCPP